MSGRTQAPSQKPPKVKLPIYSWSTVHPNAKLYYLRDIKETDLLLGSLPPGDYGFDLEWKPTFQKGQQMNPVALVQIANDTLLLLIQISAMAAIPDSLRNFLESSDYIKTGVGIQEDTVKLYMDTGLSAMNCVDLSLLAKSADNARWKGKYKAPIGLARLTEAYHGRELVKGRTSFSNWEAQLTAVQQNYAANDAHCAFTILQILREKLSTMVKAPDPICYTFDSVRSRLCEPSGAAWSPANPDYDPGPPPPPRAPRPPKQTPAPKANTVVVTEMTAVGTNTNTSTHTTVKSGRGRNRSSRWTASSTKDATWRRGTDHAASGTSQSPSQQDTASNQGRRSGDPRSTRGRRGLPHRQQPPPIRQNTEAS